jgi:hypothetical protein
MCTRSPLTVVYAPEPSMTNRNAPAACRWHCAVSPGRMIWIPAYRLFTVAGGSARPGLTSISTRRSASCSDSVSAKCSMYGRSAS